MARGYLARVDTTTVDKTVKLDSVYTDTIPHCVSFVEVFASGNVKDALGTKSASAVANGALGMHYAGGIFDVRGLVNVASTSDTVKAQYGSTLLVPASGGGINAAELRVRGRFTAFENERCARYAATWKCHAGWRFVLDASTREWATRFDTTIKTTPAAAGSNTPATADTTVRVGQTMRIPMWGANLSVWYEFFRGDIRGADSARRPVGMFLDVGASHRALRGDIAGDGFTALRTALLQEDKRNWTGAEIGLTMLYNNITSRFSYYSFRGCKTRGLCGGQIVAAVSLDAALASELLRRD